MRFDDARSPILGTQSIKHWFSVSKKWRYLFSETQLTSSFSVLNVNISKKEDYTKKTFKSLKQ